MTIRASSWSPAVNSNLPAGALFLLGVTLRASDLLVGSIERKLRLAVIERRSTPMRNGVARGTVFFKPAAEELAAMDIFMASLALARSFRKIRSGALFGIDRSRSSAVT